MRQLLPASIRRAIAAEVVPFLHGSLMNNKNSNKITDNEAAVRTSNDDSSTSNLATTQAPPTTSQVEGRVDWIRDRLECAPQGTVFSGSPLEFILELLGDVFWLHLEDIELIEMAVAIYATWLHNNSTKSLLIPKPLRLTMLTQMLALVQPKRLPPEQDPNQQLHRRPPINPSVLIERHLGCARKTLELAQKAIQQQEQQEEEREPEWHQALQSFYKTLLGVSHDLLSVQPSTVSVAGGVHASTGLAILTEQPGYLATHLAPHLLPLVFHATQLVFSSKQDHLTPMLPAIFPLWLAQARQAVPSEWSAQVISATQLVVAAHLQGIKVNDDSRCLWWKFLLALPAFTDDAAQASAPCLLKIIQVNGNTKNTKQCVPFFFSFPDVGCHGTIACRNLFVCCPLDCLWTPVARNHHEQQELICSGIPGVPCSSSSHPLSHFNYTAVVPVVKWMFEQRRPKGSPGCLSSSSFPIGLRRLQSCKRRRRYE